MANKYCLTVAEENGLFRCPFVVTKVTKVLWAMAPILFCAIHGNFVLCFSLALPIQFLCFARGGKPCRQLFGDTVPFEILNGYNMVQVEPFC